MPFRHFFLHFVATFNITKLCDFQMQEVIFGKKLLFHNGEVMVEGIADLKFLL